MPAILELKTKRIDLEVILKQQRERKIKNMLLNEDIGTKTIAELCGVNEAEVLDILERE